MILVVEDDPTLLELLILQLKHLGYSAHGAADGESAVTACDSGTDYALIFMDVALPEMSGLEATRLIRQLDNGKSKPVIIALTGQADSSACLDSGMDAFIAKPARLADLKAVLEKWLPVKPPIVAS